MKKNSCFLACFEGPRKSNADRNKYDGHGPAHVHTVHAKFHENSNRVPRRVNSKIVGIKPCVSAKCTCGDFFMLEQPNFHSMQRNFKFCAIYSVFRCAPSNQLALSANTLLICMEYFASGRISVVSRPGQSSKQACMFRSCSPVG